MLPMHKAFIAWQWSQHLHRQARHLGKVPLLLNLDETSVPIVFTHAQGNVMVDKGPSAWRSLPNQPCGRSSMRMFFTHVAIICTDLAIQPLLPQVLFVGRNVTVKAGALSDWIDALGTRAYRLRPKKAWRAASEPPAPALDPANVLGNPSFEDGANLFPDGFWTMVGNDTGTRSSSFSVLFRSLKAAAAQVPPLSATRETACTGCGPSACTRRPRARG